VTILSLIVCQQNVHETVRSCQGLTRKKHAMKSWCHTLFIYPCPQLLYRLAYILSIFPHLRSVRIVILQSRDCPSDCLQLLHISGHSKHLQNLEIFDLHDQHIFNVPCLNIDHHPPNYKFNKLTKLFITGSLGHKITFVRQLLLASKCLTHVQFENIDSLTDCYLETLIIEPASNSITHLSLKGCPKLHLPIIQSATLRSLTLTHCSDLRGFDNTSFCPLLKSLDLSFNPMLGNSDHHDIMMPRHCLLDGIGATFSCRLRTLNVRGCSSVKSITTSNINIPQGCNTDRLEYIDCSSCTCLLSISVSSNALTKLELEGCVHLQSVSISSPVLQLIELPTASLIWIYLNCFSLKRIKFTGYVGAYVNCPSLESSSALLGDEFLDGEESTALANKVNSRWGETFLALPAYAEWRG
jgi:hypothetical protein